MRTFLRDLMLLTGVTAAGGFALVKAIGTPPSPADLLFEPLIVSRPVGTSSVEHALELLRYAPDFADAAVGYAGVVPTTVVAWLTLDRSPRADTLFENLLRTAALPGQVYALAGLRRTNPARFREAARQLRMTGLHVNTFRGCIGWRAPIATLIDELKRGDWIDGFYRASPSRYRGTLPWPQN